MDNQNQLNLRLLAPLGGDIIHRVEQAQRNNDTNILNVAYRHNAILQEAVHRQEPELVMIPLYRRAHLEILEAIWNTDRNRAAPEFSVRFSRFPHNITTLFQRIPPDDVARLRNEMNRQNEAGVARWQSLQRVQVQQPQHDPHRNDNNNNNNNNNNAIGGSAPRAHLALQSAESRMASQIARMKALSARRR
jgi:inorganic triphosphatase YgiF